MGWREKIQAEMKAKGFNMKSLSARVGRGETYVRDILKRDNQPRAEHLAAVALALEISLTDLMDDAVKLPDPPQRHVVYLPSEGDIEAVLQQAIDQLVTQTVGPTKWAFPLARAVRRFLELEQEAPPEAQARKPAAQLIDTRVPNKPGRRSQPRA